MCVCVCVCGVWECECEIAASIGKLNNNKTWKGKPEDQGKLTDFEFCNIRPTHTSL